MPHLPNQHQTTAERRYKYNLLRELGLSYHVARRLKDWHYAAIDKRINMFLGCEHNSRFRMMRYCDWEKGDYNHGYND